MNKLILLLSCLALSFTATAQDTITELKPKAGDKSLEIILLSKFTANGFRYRAFSSPTNAFRLSATARYYYSNMNTNSYAINRSYFGAWIAPGLEKHFAGTRRLSPYVGAELPIGFVRSKFETDDVLIKGGGSYSSGYSRYNNSPSYFSVGLNGVAGLDFFISKRFYTGIELSTGVSYHKEGDAEITLKDTTAPATIQKGSHSIHFNILEAGGLRFGFIF